MKRFFFHNFRIIFKIERWIRRRFTKAGSLVLGGLIAAGVFGIDTRQTLAYQLFSLLLILLLLAVISSWFLRLRFIVQRELPEFATVGETLNYQVQIHNHTHKLQRSLTLQENVKLQPSSFATFMHVKEPAKHNWFDNYVGYPRWTWLMYISKGVEIAEQSLPPIPPSKIEVKLTLTPLRRGYVHFTSMTFARPDPFGLFNALYTLNVPDTLLVLPKRYPVGEFSLFSSRKYQRGGVNLAMSVGDAEEFTSLREYRLGDPLRHIHWKSWAKLGKPVVKEFQDEFFVRHALILDTFTEQVRGDKFEAAVSVAASFASTPRSSEVLLDLMFVGTQAYCFTSGRGLAHADNLLEVLACVKESNSQSFDQLCSLVKEYLASLSGCVCILLEWDVSRQYLVKLLKNAQIPSLVVVVSDSELEIDINKFPEVHVLPVGKIAEELAKLAL